MKRSDEKSVVVSGTGKGIGRAVAEHLSANGWSVIGIERTRSSDTVAAGACRDVVVGDSSKRATHQRAAEVASAHAPMWGWVNNAGITRATPLHALDEEILREIIEINGFGYMWGCATAVDVFMKQDIPGAIVNIGSIHGRVSFPDFAVYDFTKAGIDALSRSVAVSYGPLGIRANTLAPGAVWTPHLKSFIANAPDPERAESNLLKGSPAKRFASVSEVAQVTAFLLSKEASYLNGQSIALDGGWSASSGVGDVDHAVALKVASRSTLES